MGKVLLTGASGYIAAHILDILIKDGEHVVATVRSEKKADFFAKKYPKAIENKQLIFEYVPDIGKTSAFDDIYKKYSKEFTAVYHTASPFYFAKENDDIEEVIYKPAINGTRSALEGAYKFAPNVKRIVVTSSFAAIFDINKASDPKIVYSEKDWNPITAEEGKKNGLLGYLASKKFAEKAAWSFVEEHKDASFDIVTINPGYVFGPIVHDATLKTLNTSSKLVYDILKGDVGNPTPKLSGNEVDVRDVAAAHIAVIRNPKASGRYLLSSSKFTDQLISDIIQKDFPKEDHVKSHDWSKDYFKNVSNFDNSKIRGLLGRDLIPLEKTIKDSVQQFLEWEKASK